MIGYGLDGAGQFLVLLFKIYWRGMMAILSWINAAKKRQAGWNGDGEEEGDE